MSLNLKKMKTAKAEIDRIPEDTYVGRVFSVVDLGVQIKTNWKTGEEEGTRPEILITFELPTVRYEGTDDDGNEFSKPRYISKRYTASNSEKSNLYQLITKLKPGATNVSDLVGAPCMVSVGSTVTGNAKIADVIKPLSGMQIPDLENPGSTFDFDAPEEELFLKQPAWIQDIIKEAVNYSGFADSWESSDD